MARGGNQTRQATAPVVTVFLSVEQHERDGAGSNDIERFLERAGAANLPSAVGGDVDEIGVEPVVRSDGEQPDSRQAGRVLSGVPGAKTQKLSQLKHGWRPPRFLITRTRGNSHVTPAQNAALQPVCCCVQFESTGDRCHGKYSRGWNF